MVSLADSAVKRQRWNGSKAGSHSNNCQILGSNPKPPFMFHFKWMRPWDHIKIGCKEKPIQIWCQPYKEWGKLCAIKSSLVMVYRKFLARKINPTRREMPKSHDTFFFLFNQTLFLSLHNRLIEFFFLKLVDSKIVAAHRTNMCLERHRKWNIGMWVFLLFVFSQNEFQIVPALDSCECWS